ncbi:MAG TPA: bifunctional metallophosphatase/5'-nucleotidase, partial [Novosphingobium sp.]|nr:bifunctional metallophosphatase/5'-nucleotidase [Novosphingobium sp.]
MKRLLFCLALALPLSATAGNLPPRAGAQPSAAHAGAAAVLGAHRAEAEAPVDIGLIALNDFHGHLLPPHAAMMAPDGRGGAVAVPAGGAAWLASAVDAARARHPHALTLSAGDILSASPSESALFLDEPAIGVMNRIGLDYNAVGNHEFDRGRAELLRIAHGGCEQTTLRKPCALEPYAGARFPFLAANTLTEDGTPLFPATALRSFGKGARRVRVGIIGLTLRGTGALSSPEGHKGLRWADEADTANALVPQLKAEGADVVVVLIHQGGRTDSAQPDPNGCSGFHGGLKEILDRLDPRVDLVISGHTHWAYVCHYPVAGGAHSLLVTSAGLWGEAITEIDLKVDPARHLLLSAEARNIIVQSDGYGGPRGAANTPLYPRFAPRADIAAYVQRYADAAQKLAGQQVGWLAGPAEKTEGALGSTGGPLGRLIADAQLAATRPAGAEISFMNPFGVRASLLPAGDRAVNWGQLFAVQPFGNDLVTLTLTG